MMIKDYGRDDAPADKWTTKEVRDLFIIHSFLAPYCQVTRKSDKKTGWLEFSHNPRFYFNFKMDEINA